MSIVLWVLCVAGSALVLTQSAVTAPLRDWLSGKAGQTKGRTMFGAASKLVSCPMCSGFWLGLAWSYVSGDRGVPLAAHGFVGSVASAIAVALWMTLHEAHQGVALWRYLNPPPPPAKIETVMEDD